MFFVPARSLILIGFRDPLAPRAAGLFPLDEHDPVIPGRKDRRTPGGESERRDGSPLARTLTALSRKGRGVERASDPGVRNTPTRAINSWMSKSSSTMTFLGKRFTAGTQVRAQWKAWSWEAQHQFGVALLRYCGVNLPVG